MKACKCGKKVLARGMCRSCYNSWYYNNNREYFREYNKEWHRKHRDYKAERQREYYKTEKGRKNVKKAVKKYELRNGEKKKAWVKVRGTEFEPCEVCGCFPTHRHHDDYSKPDEITYLCPFHHKQRHKELI